MSEKTATDFVATQEVLAANLEMFHRRALQTYRPLGSELRKLLCDTQKSTLLPRVFQDVQLHKLASTERYERDPEHARGVTFFSTGGVLVTRELIRYELELAPSGARLPLDAWLSQPRARNRGHRRVRSSVHSDGRPSAASGSADRTAGGRSLLDPEVSERAAEQGAEAGETRQVRSFAA
jgi:hypothetical protein